MSDGRNVFKALLTGTALGAALGILFAPRSGEKTREQLKEFSEKTRDSIDLEGGNLADQLSDLRSRVKELTEQAAESGQQRVEEELEALTVAFQEGREVLHEERSRRQEDEPEADA